MQSDQGKAEHRTGSDESAQREAVTDSAAALGFISAIGAAGGFFAKGAHRLFRNVAKSITGVSATTAGSTVIVGIVGVDPSDPTAPYAQPSPPVQFMVGEDATYLFGFVFSFSFAGANEVALVGPDNQPREFRSYNAGVAGEEGDVRIVLLYQDNYRFDDLVAANALLRPGPLDTGMHLVFINRKLGREAVPG